MTHAEQVAVHTEPTQSFEFICGWFERSSTTAKAQGKKDAAILWQDGLDQLQHIASQRDDLVTTLKMIRHGISSGAVKSKPIMCGNPQTDESMEMKSLGQIIDEALNKAGAA
jgi:hypothetical protein